MPVFWAGLFFGGLAAYLGHSMFAVALVAFACGWLLGLLVAELPRE